MVQETIPEFSMRIIFSHQLFKISQFFITRFQYFWRQR